MKLDILVIAAHPDDAELCCGGTILAHVQQGYKVGIIDLTRGELGTRGTPDLREREAAEAARLMGIQVRENLCFADGFFRNDEAHQRALARAIREYQPDIVLTNAVHDRHPDHGRGAELVSDACFVSGLRRVETESRGRKQAPWRPTAVYHFIQDRHIVPDFVMDVTPFWDRKMECLRAYASQFHDPSSNEPITHISTADFFPFIEARAREFGHAIGVTYGEGFTKERYLGVSNLFHLI
ncbi:bacillithiol biosynthesis deacetylase BshB1 [Catalinimonas alkaloidigena]|uniref:Bacillithiol biosynthesis deacetylase BshB1 n=1 Tax=Catalinimonas alkaloidigena TaxID=1075417 RepID=A0A1G9K9W0_9BACT|nr:bacillithiol biosynthesis deacetylase BshB1 [Catalinimonas alkaloidigena]SDL46214.1 bacillithiol biosynthesis deacetylase BshB1 [Catalinimonas alkaloidigena]